MAPRLQTNTIRFDSLPSTNTEAARQAQRGAPEGLCVVAREQTAGRGRRERAWLSPADAGLYFSIVLRPVSLEKRFWPLVTLMAAVAVHDSLLEAYDLTTDIKWPNDILVNDRKLCGILAETVETVAGSAVILGIGINLKESAFPEALRDSVTSVEALIGDKADREKLLAALRHSIVRRYEMLLTSDGAERILRGWAERSSYAHGARVRVESEEEVLEGVTRGLEADGALRVETHAGEIKIVRAGEITTLRHQAQRN